MQEASIASNDTCNAISLNNNILHPTLDDDQVRDCLDLRLHRLAVELPVRLRPRTLHGRSFGAVEKTELNTCPIRNSAHQAIKRIDFSH